VSRVKSYVIGHGRVSIGNGRYRRSRARGLGGVSEMWTRSWPCLANGILIFGFFFILRRICSRLRLAVLFVREKTLADLFVRGSQRQRILGKNEGVRGCELANHNVNWAKNYLSRTRCCRWNHIMASQATSCFQSEQANLCFHMHVALAGGG
jgi:hypothetical protein